MVSFGTRRFRQTRHHYGLVNFCNKYIGVALMDTTKRKTWLRHSGQHCNHRNSYSSGRNFLSRTKQLRRWNSLLLGRNCNGRFWFCSLHHLWVRPWTARRINDRDPQQIRGTHRTRPLGHRKLGSGGRLAVGWHLGPRHAPIRAADWAINRSLTGSRFSGYPQVTHRIKIFLRVVRPIAHGVANTPVNKIRKALLHAGFIFQNL